jgi:hypothetical protein
MNPRGTSAAELATPDHALDVQRLEGRQLAELEPELLQEGLRPRRVEHQPGWLAAPIHGRDVHGFAWVGRRDGKVLGYLPYLFRPAHRHKFWLGEFAIGSLPLSLRQTFGDICVTSDDGIRNALVAAFLSDTRQSRAITLEETPTESLVWKAVQHFARPGYGLRQGRISNHVLIDLPASMAEYLAQFSSKSRYNMKRRTRLLESAVGDLAFECVTAPDRVLPFLLEIESVVRRTYHYRLLGKDLTSNNRELVSRLRFLASRGWLRAYVLRAGTTPLAYCIGHLTAGTFFYENPGFDPDYAEHSPGNELLLRVIGDLIETRAARCVDFGAGEAQYKNFLGTRSYPEVAAILWRRDVGTAIVMLLDATIRALSRHAVALLSRLGIKSLVKNYIRRGAAR